MPFSYLREQRSLVPRTHLNILTHVGCTLVD